jgi:hypothetical protein
MSEFRFACPHCSQRISGDATYQGTQITCPLCKQTLTVPSPGARTIKHPAGPEVSSPKNISRLALVSFVCSLGLAVGSIPGIILGHFALVRLRRDPSLTGKKLATAGLVLGYSFLLLTLATVLVGFTAFTSPHGRQLTPQERDANTPDVLAKRRVDEVKVGDPVSEYEHRLADQFSSPGEFMAKLVRTAFSGGVISYVMKVDPAQPMFLYCTYWGNDSGGRQFDVLVNDKVIARQTLNFNDPGRFFDVEYAIPAQLTHGQTNVTVVFQGYPGKTVGGIFGCQMLKR